MRTETASHWSYPDRVEKVKLTIGNLEGSLEEKLVQLSKLDHFHGGGLWVTKELLKLMDTKPEMQGIDIGCGMGGPMRWLAHKTGCRMTGVDITPEFIEVAEFFTKKLNMSRFCTFSIADACSLPFNAEFDFALMMAVSCNISDRQALCKSIYRTLKAGASIGMLEIVKGKNEGLVLPVPWSADGKRDTNFLLTEDETVKCFEGEDFRLVKKRVVSKEVLEWFKKSKTDTGIGIHIAIPAWNEIARNQITNIEKDHIRFVLMVFSKN